jgi:hypothetical protein
MATGNVVASNLIHENGVWGKQTSPYVQSVSCQVTLANNVMFNGPRAGINFNDGFGGGNLVVNNLLFNLVRRWTRALRSLRFISELLLPFSGSRDGRSRPVQFVGPAAVPDHSGGRRHAQPHASPQPNPSEHGASMNHRHLFAAVTGF